MVWWFGVLLVWFGLVLGKIRHSITHFQEQAEPQELAGKSPEKKWLENGILKEMNQKASDVTDSAAHLFRVGFFRLAIIKLAMTCFVDSCFLSKKANSEKLQNSEKVNIHWLLILLSKNLTVLNRTLHRCFSSTSGRSLRHKELI